jgi:hypothetical protein
MKLKNIFLLLVVAQVSDVNGFGSKAISNESQAGRALEALHSFWLNKLSDDLKKGCAEQKKCEALAQSMSNVIALASKRPDNVKAAESIDKIKKNTALPEDILRASLVIEAYGEATIENNELGVLKHTEPTSGPWMFSIGYRPAIEEVINQISEIGKKANWSDGKIEQEKKQIIELLKDFLKQKNNERYQAVKYK